MDIFTISFFGHRDFSEHIKYEPLLQKLLYKLISNHEYVEFLVGRNGEFDQFASSSIRTAKKMFGSANSSHILVLPYPTADFIKNEEYYYNYYDEIEICDKSYGAHYKAAFQIRNREMVNRSDLIICCIVNNYGGAYKAVQYAKSQNKTIFNLADFII